MDKEEITILRIKAEREIAAIMKDFVEKTHISHFDIAVDVFRNASNTSVSIAILI